MKLRPFHVEDAMDCWRLFRDTVHRVNCRDYSESQLSAWAPETVDLDCWTQRFEGRFAVVMESGAQLIGFADMSHDGHLDRLFVSADHQRRGVAKRMWQELRSQVERLGIRTVFTEASITAKPFFESVGFRVIKCQQVECRGVILTNYRMEWRQETKLNSG